jgi:hypothetical protein
MMWFRQKIIYWRVSPQDSALSMPLTAWLEAYQQVVLEEPQEPYLSPLKEASSHTQVNSSTDTHNLFEPWQLKAQVATLHYPINPLEIEAQVFHQLAQEVGIYLHQVTSFRALLEAMSLLQPDWVMIGVEAATLRESHLTSPDLFDPNEETNFKTADHGLSALIPHIKKVLLLQQRLWLEHPLSLGSGSPELQKELPSRIPLFVWHLPPDAKVLSQQELEFGFQPLPLALPDIASPTVSPDVSTLCDFNHTEVEEKPRPSPEASDSPPTGSIAYHWLVLQHLFDGADDVLAHSLSELEVTIRLLAHSRRLVESQRWPDTLMPAGSVLQRFLLREVAQAQLAMAESYQQQRYNPLSSQDTSKIETSESIEASFAQVVSTPQAWMILFKIRAWDTLKRLYGKSFSDEATFLTTRMLLQETQAHEVVFQLTEDVFVWWGSGSQRAEAVADTLTQQWRSILQHELFMPYGQELPEMLVESVNPQLTQRFPAPILKAIVAPVSWRGHELFQLTPCEETSAHLRDTLSEEYLQRLNCVTGLLAQMHSQLSSIWHHPSLHWLTRHGQLETLAPSGQALHKNGTPTLKTVWVGMKDPTMQQLMSLSLSLEGWHVVGLDALIQRFENTGQCPTIQVLHQWVLADMTEAYMPFLEMLRLHYPQLTLVTCGTEVLHRDRALYQLGSELHATHPFSLLELMKWVALRYPSSLAE